MSLMNAGKYNAVVKEMSPFYRKGGQLSLAIKFETEEGKEIVGKFHIELNDGSISEAMLKRLRLVFLAWDGTIEGLFIGANFLEIPCEIDVEDQVSEANGKTYSNVKWVNPPGGAPGMEMPETVSKKDLLAKYGSRFRAMAGGSKSKSAPTSAPKPTPPIEEEATEEVPPVEEVVEEVVEPPKKQASAKKPTPAKKPAAKPEQKLDMHSCWAVLLKRAPLQAEALWDKFITEAGGNKDYDDITQDEWVDIMALCDGTNSLE